MEEYLPFVSIDIWTIILTWVNLFVLFLLLKKFLFKPINEMLNARNEEIESSYKEAESAKAKADMLKGQYEQKMVSVKTEADEIIKSAVEKANRRSDGIVNDASEQAKHIMKKSQKQIEQEKRNAVSEAKEDIASMVVDVVEKVIEKRFDDTDDKKLISDIIDRI